MWGHKPTSLAFSFSRIAPKTMDPVITRTPATDGPATPMDPNAPGSASPLWGVNQVPFHQAAQVVYEAQKANADATAQAMTEQPVASSLLNHLEMLRNQAIMAKLNSGVTERLLDCQRRRRNEYDEQRKAMLKKYNLPEYFPPLTQTKCIHTEAWLRDLTMPYGAKIWMCEPSEIPELSKEETISIESRVVQDAEQAILAGNDQGLQASDLAAIVEKEQDTLRREKKDFAKKRAKRMESKILDNLQDCDWRTVFEEFRSNVVTYGTGFLKGPYTKTVKVATWQNGKRVVVDKVIPICSAPSPHDMYPAPWSKNVQDGYMIERIQTYRPALNACRKLEYYRKEEIEALLKEQPTAKAPILNQVGDYRRATMEDKGNQTSDDRIECWEFHGSLPGFMLDTWGLKGIESTEDYEMVVLWSATHILKVMPAWNDTAYRGYAKAVFKTVVGSFWGIGTPNLMSASQDRACSVMTQMLQGNAWSGGPVFWLYANRLQRPEDALSIHGGKVIPFTQDDMSPTTAPPMGMLEVTDKTIALNTLYQGCLTDSDNESGVPAYMYGANQQNASGAVRTFSGLSTLMNAAARGVKDALMNMDDAVDDFISNWADWLNQYSDDDSIKGDVRVICTGATGLFIQEMQMDRMTQMLDRVKDPNVMQALGAQGVAFMVSLIRGMAQMLKQDVSYLPSEDDILNMAKKAAAMPPGAPGAPGQVPQTPVGAQQSPASAPSDSLTPGASEGAASAFPPTGLPASA